MKRSLSVLLIILLVLSLASCVLGDAEELTERGFEGYYYEESDGIISITNYHPYDFFSLPDYQELVGYGEDAGLENDGTVYFIYVVDTSLDPDSDAAYYSAEFEGTTRELLCEEGEYFTDDAAKTQTVAKLLDMIETFIK